ncbi:hypothetical protein Xcc3_06170 [Xanthomonas campestris pv. campestris]|uniref:Exported protein n=2 Tax=Xanthomonas campestris TaxID=339 RepID=B0RNC7_XANCB|nr:hypothetical protein Xcc3_06170 [Xanthomonas campestris pv. campestris]CAP49962.1 putative exported protein [Xanthomonas campestris pv. campestris]
MRMMTGLLLALPLLLGTGAASATKVRQSVAYPQALQGIWDLGPHACKLPMNPDSDTPIHIEKTWLRGHEHQQTPISIRRVSSDPHAWLVSAKSDIAPDIRTDDLYILKGGYLVISDGKSVSQYRRCQ